MAGYLDFGMAVTAPDRDEVRQASLRLPERQRAALELREGKGLSYEQIAAELGTSAGSVAQLLERARINLYDELRGTALASVAAPSPECERALPLIAARQDRELAPSSGDAAWLDGHLAGCERCRLGEEQMRDAAALYRGDAPAAASSTAAQPRSSEAAPPASPTATGRPPVAVRLATAQGPSTRPSRKGATRLAAGLGALLLLAGIAVAALAGGGGGDSGDPAAAKAASHRSHLVSPRAAKRARAAHHGKKRRRGSGKSADATTTVAGLLPEGSSPAPTVIAAPLGTGGGNSSAPASGRNPSSGKAAVHPPEQTTASKPPPKSKPAAPESTPSSQPPPEPAPPASTTEAEPPPAAEEADHPGHSGDPPGKAVGNPSEHPAH